MDIEPTSSAKTMNPADHPKKKYQMVICNDPDNPEFECVYPEERDGQVKIFLYDGHDVCILRYIFKSSLGGLSRAFGKNTSSWLGCVCEIESVPNGKYHNWKLKPFAKNATPFRLIPTGETITVEEMVIEPELEPKREIDKALSGVKQ